MEIKRLTIPFDMKQMDEEDNEFFKFEGYGSTFGNVDLGRDRVIPGAFSRNIQEMFDKGQKLPVLWQHDHTMPLGVYIDLREDERGLFVKGKMPKSDDFVRGRVFPQMKAGSVSALSIGYCTRDFDIVDGVRNLKELELFEISLVTMPMNQEAGITDVKRSPPFSDLPLAELDTPWDSEAATGRVRQKTDSVESPSADYKKAFFYYDPEKPDDFGGYKLSFADVIDGELKAVPRGIFAAAAAMQGARGGVDLPEGDRKSVVNHINRYYSKMDRESPLKGKCLNIDTIDAKNLTVNEFERIMKSCQVTFNNEAIKIMISNIKKSVRSDADNSRSDAVESSDIIDQKVDKLITLMERK